MRIPLSPSLGVILGIFVGACVAGAPKGRGPSGDESNGGSAAAGDAITTGSQKNAEATANAFSQEQLSADIAYLAADERQGRFPGTQGDEETLAYIEKRFESIGLTAPFSGSHRQPFVGDGLKTSNVVGSLEGSDPAVASEIVVIGAHHDHRGVKAGQIQNGANDNASGVAAVLAIAQAIKNQPQAPRRTVVFATFGYEENDDDGTCWGSDFYVNNPPPNLPTSNIVYMMNLDMVGSYPSVKRLDAFGTFAGTPGRASVEAKRTASELKLKLGEVPEENDSDFQAFCSAGIPYVYFSTDDDRCYHKACDDLDKIDFPSMIAVTTLAHEVFVDLANSATDLKASRRASSTCTR